MSHQDAGAMFLAKARDYLHVEYRTKLRRAVEAMPADAIWRRADAHSNSAGNLLLHLTGNVRQWIVAGVGGEASARDRASEFAATDGAPAGTLLAALDRTLDDADRALAQVSPHDLTRRLTIQGREVAVIEAIFHVVEHFSMHLGQIILLAKAAAPGAIHFYEDEGGLARPVWREPPPRP